MILKLLKIKSHSKLNDNTKMEYLVKDKKLELKYQPGKGAWTYHIQVPNTKHIVGKWGFMKVAGTIDNYKIESINLAKLGDQDKLISINSEIRKAINKTGGDIVTVTLYLLTSKEQITKKEILDTFKESGVLKAFKKLTEDEQSAIIEKITAQKSDEKQVKMILKYIEQLNK
ncbi:MAG TPA: DUF1905 domain-containing protein [Sediminibacterium sp.]|jgi:hypothetical protein|uniref:DUF1905 domain-containing protein n=1 Tax=Sediminibacterium sp. TaxID=1917865 RepID=UPI000AE7B07F|nr:DUF1905 domain-containing protein [Sediminibacterium sp.]HLD54370.1 DUF1905 domain-containing protein [Sediminibacterium sp.]